MTQPEKPINRPLRAPARSVHGEASLNPHEVLAHLDWLQRLCRSLVSGGAGARGAEADDLAQETVSRALVGTIRPRDVRSYLGGIARNVRRESARRSHRRRERQLDQDSLDRRELPDDAAHHHLDTLRQVLVEVDRLPRAQRSAVYAVYVEGLELDEIAARDDLAASTVRANVARGLARLRERLDEKRGGRTSWSAALAPWVMAQSTPAPASPLVQAHRPSLSTPKAAPKATPKATLPAAPAAASAAALTGIGFIAMATKLAAAGAAVVLAVFVVSSIREDSPSAASSSAVATVAPGPDELPEGASMLEPAATTRESREAAGSPRPEAADAPDAMLSTASEPSSVRVVDSETGEGVPEVVLSFQLDSGTERQTTNKDGRVTVSVDSSEERSYEVELRDHYSSYSTAAYKRRRTVTLPGEAELSFAVGPTFKLSGSILECVHSTDFEVIARGPGISIASQPRAVLRRLGRRRDWIRFQETFGEPGGVGPWTLDFRSDDGHWTASVEVNRRAGIEADPVPVYPQARGVLEFSLAPVEGPLPPLVTVHVTGPDGNEYPALRLLDEHTREASNGATTHLDASVRRLGFLDAGTYRWASEMDGERTEGSASVQLGEVTQVSIKIESTDVRERFVDVLVEANGSPDLSTWPAQLIRTDGGLETIPATLERVPGEPSRWRAPIGPLPGGEWSFAMLPADGFAVEPRTVTIGEAGGNAPMLVRRVAQVEVALTVNIEESLRSQLTVFHVDGIAHTNIEPLEDGTYRANAAADRATAFLVCLPDHDLTRVEIDPGRTSDRLHATPVKGTLTRAAVLDPGLFGPREGVEVIVNGESIGKTDVNGEIWFEPEGGAVMSIELGSDDAEKLNVIAAPSGGAQTAFGYLFAVSEK